MFHYINNFEDLATGKVVTSIRMRVLDPVSGDQIAIYADENGTAYTGNDGVETVTASVNPKGRVDFWVTDGSWDLEILGSTGERIDYIRKINMVGDITPEAAAAKAAAETARDEAVASAVDALEYAGVATDGALRAEAASQYRVSICYATYAALAAVTGTAGQSAAVFGDVGTHTDPVVGGTVDNAGIYFYSVSPAGWQRVANLEAADAAYYAGLAATSAASVNGPLLTARVSSLFGTADTYTTISGVPAAATIAITANQAYEGCAIDAGTDITVGTVIDSVMPELLVDSAGTGTLCTNIKCYVYSGSTAAGGINTAPPHTPATGGAWTLLETVTINPADAGLTPGAASRATATIPITPIVVAAGTTYAFIFDAVDVSVARVRMGIGTIDKSGDGRQRIYGWYHTSTSIGTWSNRLQTQKIALRIGTKAATDVLDLDDYVSTISARQLTDEQKAEVELISTVARINDNNLLAESKLHPLTLSYSATFWGDSLTAETATVETSIMIMADYVTGTLTNNGVGGETAAQIDARMAAASAGVLGGYSFVWSGTNDLGSATDNSGTIKATIDTSMGRVNAARSVVAGPRTGVIGTRNFGVVMKVRALLKSTYGAHTWSTYDRHPIVGSRSKTDNDSFVIGGMPLHLMADSTHDGPPGPIHTSKEWTRMLRAMELGTPFIQPDVAGIKNGDAAGTGVLSTRILGGPKDVIFYGKRCDDIVRLDTSTGAMTRGAAAVSFDYRDVYLEGRHRKGNHIGRVTLVRQVDGTDPNLGGVRFDTSKGATAIGTPGLVGAAAGKKMTVVVCARFLSTASGGLIGPGATLNVLNQSFRFIPRTSGGTSIASATAPQADNPENYNMYFFTVDTNTGVQRCQSAVNDKTAVTATPTADALVGFDTYVALFMSTGAYLTGMDIKSIWISTDSWDFTTLSNRALFTTGAPYNVPKDLTATGIVSGVTPLVYLYGRVGDFILGLNRGSGGDLYFPPWIDSTLCGLSSPPDLA